MIDLGDIQGDILRAYGNRYACTSYLFARVGHAAAGRAWLRELRVTSAQPWTGEKPDTAVNVAFGIAGLAALGVSAATLESFSDEFRQGMAARSGLLGDGDPAGWDAGLAGGAAHVLLTVNAIDTSHLESALDALHAGLAGAGLEVIHTQHCRLLQGAREHFGFADGVAQPAIEGVSEDKAPGGGVPEANGGWRALALGEFILGYGDEQTRDDPARRLPSAPAGALGRSSTYMVWRKLHQDVARFRRMLRDGARPYDGDEAQLAAKVVGRWANGTPLVTSPDREIPGFSADAAAANAFRYADADPDGRRCPLGAHIRRTNPRDALGFDGRLSFRHRIIRRGMPYGPLLPAGATEDDGADRGLVFVCFNASLSRQFEGIQVQWVNDGNIFGLGHDTDYLLDGTSKLTVQGAPPFFLGPQGPFVSLRGGDYLFVPGLTGLAAIAAGSA